jgi:Na+-transporting methylmalonyl-CoA/oxaloacetate decarboxylase gamma subunit
MQAELLQCAGVGVVFLVIVFLWLRIVYLPARTPERWQGDRPRSRGRRS